MALSQNDKEVLSWIEAHYHARSFPDPQRIKNAFPHIFFSAPAVEKWLSQPAIRNSLANRGTLPQAGSLTPQQRAAILLVANLTDKRATSTKLKSLGITTTQWAAWKKDPSFKAFLYHNLNSDFDSSVDRAFSGLLSAVDKGNPRAVELYMELTGRQATENERNYRLAISRIVESISRHVKDPAVIAAIAADFDKIEAGQDPLLNLKASEPETQWRGLEPSKNIITMDSYSLEDSI